MLKHILYRTLTALFGLCALALAVMTVITMIPTANSEGLAVKETLRVSSSALDNSASRYVSQIQGILTNGGDESLTVDALKVKISDGRIEREMVLEGFTLPARVNRELLYEWQDANRYDRVNGVVAVIGGKDVPLANATAEMPFDFGAVIFLALGALSALIAVHFGKQSYYLIQEDKLREAA